MNEQATLFQILMRKRLWLATGLGMLMVLSLWNLVSAAGPPKDGPKDNRQVALVSTAAECLVVEAGQPNSVSTTLQLVWEGEIEESFLVLSVAGSEGEHSLYINGQRVGSVPVQPEGEPCQATIPVRIPVPASVLVRGQNRVTITNDANINDGWTAAQVHLEIQGRMLSGPPVAVLEATVVPVSSRQGIGTMGVVSGTVALTSTYELAQGRVISQVVWYQVPMSYTGSVSVPLIIALHGMGDTGQWIRDYLAGEANRRGWLLAAPDMHGRYYINHGKYALGWVGAQHDIMDTIEYMMSEYQVDPSRIYIAGGSMGGQTTAMMTAKYPDVFAAAVPWKPFTDLAQWYNEREALGDPYGGNTKIRKETGGTPSTVPFEYQRRSPIRMPQNSRLVPIKMWHDVDDQLVPIHHSRDWRDAINGWNPPTPVTLVEVPSWANDCPPDSEGDLEHCYDPPPSDIFDFLSGFTLDSDSPVSVSLRTDESKPYYWLNIVQTGGDHWSEIEATYNPLNQTVTATISDTQPLTLAFNLGSIPIKGPGGVDRSGMRLPATTYLVYGGGNNYLHNYVSGYLTTTLMTTGRFSLTISAIRVEASASPSMVLAGQGVTSTIQVSVQDHQGHLAPDGAIVELSTTEGTFPNSASTYTQTLLGGWTETTLTLGPEDTMAQVTARVEMVTDTVPVDIIHPAVEILVIPNLTKIFYRQMVTYTYRVTNTGDITLTTVTITDDSGTPGDSSDDLIVCENITLSARAATSCFRSAVLTQTTTSTATVTGQDPLGNEVAGVGSVTVTFQERRVYLPLIWKHD